MKEYDPNRSIGFVLSDVARLLRRNFNRRIEKFGLTPAQCQALAHLAGHQGIKQGALAQILEVQPITLCRVIDRLASAGWVERRPNPDDRRTVQLFLTEAAGPILDFMWAQAIKTREETLETLSAEDCELLLDTLHTMRTNLLRSEAAFNRPAGSDQHET